MKLEKSSVENMSLLEANYQDILGGEVTQDIVNRVLDMKLRSPKKKVSSSPQQPEFVEKYLVLMRKVTEESIAGLQKVKKMLRDKVINPVLRPDIHIGLYEAPKGILLFGPPGTGKTLLAKWMACESGASFFEATPSALVSKYQAEHDSPSLIFIDEIDSLLTKRSDKEEDSTIRMKNQLLQMMDGVSSSEKMVVVVGATNRPDMLDEAALRRLSKRVAVPLPDCEARKQQIRKLLMIDDRCRSAVTERELYEISETLDGWNGSDVRTLCKKAAEYSYDDALDEYGSITKIPGPNAFRPICLDDFKRALKEVHATSSGSTSKAIDEWAVKFGYSKNLYSAKSIHKSHKYIVWQDHCKNRYPLAIS